MRVAFFAQKMTGRTCRKVHAALIVSRRQKLVCHTGGIWGEGQGKVGARRAPSLLY